MNGWWKFAIVVIGIMLCHNASDRVTLKRRNKELEQRIAAIEDSTKDVLDTRMWVDKRHFSMLQSEVAYHSKFFVEDNYWRSADLDQFNDYFVLWGFKRPK